MLRKINRIIKDYIRPKRLAFGKWVWDRKENIIQSKGKDLIEEQNIKSILFLRYDGKIGDMVINTLMFYNIKKAYPNVKIGVVTKGAAKDIIKNNPYVDKIYDYNKSISKVKSLADEVAKEDYDLLIDFSEVLRVRQMMFINLCKAKINMGVNKAGWKLFDLNLEDRELDKHITNRYKKILKTLGLVNIDMSYDLHLTKGEEEFGLSLKGKLKEEKLVVVNPYGASKYRTFNQEKIKEIVEIFLKDGNNGITFVYPPDKKNEIEGICKAFKERVYFPGEINSILETAGILKCADLIVTPDTSIVHLGVAFDKEMIAVYKSDEGSEDNNSLVWGPGSDKVRQVFYASNLKLGEKSDVNDFNVEDLVKEI